MFTDALAILSSAQAVTTTANSTNTYDLGQARDIGEGEPIWVDFLVGTAFTAAGAATLTVTLVTADDAALSVNVTGIGATAAIPKATLIAGYRFILRVNPQLGTTGHRYLGVTYTVATGPMTAGAITASIVKDMEDGLGGFYASGFTVS